MSLLSRIFGGKRQKSEVFLENTMQTLLSKAGIKLSFDVKVSEDNKKVLLDLFGEDEALVKDKDAQLLDALQLFLKRAAQNQLPDERVGVIVDCDSYRAQSDDDLIKLAEKLKGLVLKKKKAVYFRALPPRERKMVHQYFSEDKRIRTKSVGDGVFKKIKIMLAQSKPNPSNKQSSNKPKTNESKGNGPSNGSGRKASNKVSAPKKVEAQSESSVEMTEAPSTEV